MTTDKEHLQWMLNRLVEVYGENRNVDYMVRMQKIIDNTKTELNLHIVSKCGDLDIKNETVTLKTPIAKCKICKEDFHQEEKHWNVCDECSKYW